MSIAINTAVEPEAQVANTALRQGQKPLERLATVSLDAAKVDSELNRTLVKEARRLNFPGFRKNSKVVPASFRKNHEDSLLKQILHHMAGVKVVEMLEDEGLRVFPGMRMLDHQLDRGKKTYEVDCKVEVFPEVPAPGLSGRKLRKPVARTRAEDLERVLENIRSSMADWKKVDRSARDGDRIRYRHMGLAPDDEDATIMLGDPRVDPKVAERFKDAKAGDEIVLERPPLEEGGDPIEVKVTVTAIEWGSLPEMDLDLVRKFDPELGSVDAFREKMSERIEGHAGELAENVLSARMLHMLDEATPVFDLPEEHVRRMTAQRIDDLLSAARERGIRLADEVLGEEVNKRHVRHDLRRSLVFNAFLKEQGVKLGKDDIEESLRDMANQSGDARAFMAEAEKNPGVMDKAREKPLMRKALQAFEELVEVETVEMDVEELGALLQQGDPEAPPPDLTGDGVK